MNGRLKGVRIGALCLAFAAIAAWGWAQDTSLTGTASDATDARLPGVTITALHVDTGNTFLGAD